MADDKFIDAYKAFLAPESPIIPLGLLQATAYKNLFLYRALQRSMAGYMSTEQSLIIACVGMSLLLQQTVASMGRSTISVEGPDGEKIAVLSSIPFLGEHERMIKLDEDSAIPVIPRPPESPDADVVDDFLGKLGFRDPDGTE